MTKATAARARASMVAPGLLLALLGCGPEEPAPEPGTLPGGADDADLPSTRIASAANTFDPGAVQPGDTVLGLVVISKNVERAAPIDSVWVGDVLFEGDLVVHGVYQPHFDFPEVAAPCFHVTDSASQARVPRFAVDAWTSENAKTWFCFSNPEVALDLLGPLEQPREMVIALSRYRVVRHFSDVWDEAELAELLEVGAESVPTLRNP